MVDDVITHYDNEGLTDRIMGAMAAAGLDLANLDRDVLAGVDEFHLGGRSATEALLTDVAMGPGWTVIDVGCGIGGAARAMALDGCSVLGVDLTPSFVETARQLTAGLGWDDSIRFEIGSGERLPAEDASVDLVTMLHVGMNIDDKSALMNEFARVVRPGGVVAVYDIMRIGEGEITFPVPWASQPDHSFVAVPDTYVEAMIAAGLSEISTTSRLGLVTDILASQRDAPPPVLNLAHLMGPDLPTMFANLVTLLRDGVLAPIQVIGRR